MGKQHIAWHLLDVSQCWWCSILNALQHAYKNLTFFLLRHICKITPILKYHKYI